MAIPSGAVTVDPTNLLDPAKAGTRPRRSDTDVDGPLNPYVRIAGDYGASDNASNPEQIRDSERARQARTQW